MGVEKEFLEVKLFSGFIYSDEGRYREVKEQLVSRFSPVDLETGAIPFTFTDYYNREMGETLFRRFVSFTSLIDPVQLPDIKLLTNRIEIDTTNSGNRTINLDPGYLSDANVIIATTKNYYHRVPLARGIYSHMEYVLKGKQFHFMEWTYPDFKSEAYLDFFRQLLVIYKQQLKEKRIRNE